jgi:hypothetical protein
MSDVRLIWSSFRRTGPEVSEPPGSGFGTRTEAVFTCRFGLEVHGGRKTSSDFRVLSPNLDPAPLGAQLVCSAQTMTLSW